MKIRHRLYISALISIILIAILFVLLYKFSYSMNKELEKSEIANRLVKDTADLIFLVDEYIIAYQEKSEIQWKQKYNSIMKLLTDIKTDRSFGTLKSEFEHLQEHFLQLKSERPVKHQSAYKEEAGTRAEKSTDTRDMPIFHIRLHSQNILMAVFKIARETGTRIRNLQTRSNFIFFTFAMLIFIIIVIDSFLTIRRITRPLSALIKGVNRVKSGNMEYDIYIDRKRPDILGKDEVGELASAFNNMGKRLKDAFENLRSELQGRKQAQKALIEERDKLKTLMDGLAQIGIGVDIVSRNYDVLTQSPSSIERFGHLEGEKCFHGYMGFEGPCDDCPMKRAIQNDRVESVELTGTDGKYYLLFSAPLHNSDGTVDKVIEVIMDISERKQAEVERTRLQNYLKNIIDSMPSVLVGVDADLTVTQWNLEAEEMTGIDADNARGKVLSNVFPHLSLDMEQIRKTIKERRQHKELKVEGPKDENTSFFDITVYPLISNGIEGAVIRIDDVTERVRLEEMMIQTEKMMSVGGLAAGMAHEINNPLGIIMQGIQNTMRRLSPEMEKNKTTADECGVSLEKLNVYLNKRNINEYLEGMREAAVRASKIVKNMLDFSRSSDSKMAPTDIHQILDGVLELAANDYDLKKKYDFRHIQIVKEYDHDIGHLRCTKTEIEQVMLNLLKNAAHAMAEIKKENYTPQISIKTHKKKGYAVIELSDNGPGMDEKISKRIFEPFFTTKTVGIGTGLGLSVSYFIITNNHQGKMSVETAAGKGTTFTIELPLIKE